MQEQEATGRKRWVLEMAGYLHSQLKGAELFSIQVCEKLHFCLSFHQSSLQTLLIVMRKPFTRVDPYFDEAFYKEYPFQEVTEAQKHLPSPVRRVYAQDLSLIFEGSKGEFVFSFETQREGFKFVEGFSQEFQENRLNLKAPDESSCIKKRELERAFMFKASFRALKKIEKTLETLKKEKIELPSQIEIKETQMQWVMEHASDLSKAPFEILKNTHYKDKRPGEIIQEGYRQIKKWKKRLGLIDRLIAHTEAKKQTVSFVKKEPSKPPEKKEGRIFMTTVGEKIQVGRTAKENEALTFKKASGNDYWFHAHNAPGAHVVIYAKNPSDEALKKGAFLAKFYSQEKEAPFSEVIQTQVKYLKRGKKAGEVIVMKKKIVRVPHDPAFMTQLFSKFPL